MTTQNLLEKYKPVLYLHNKEEYFPISMENYIANSVLKAPNLPPVDSPPVQIMVDEKHNTTETVLDVKKEIWPGVKPSEINTVPFYGRVYEDLKYLYLVYIFNYSYNGAYNICEIPGLGNTIKKIYSNFDDGAHQSDIEHVTVKVDKKTQKIVNIFYSAHSSAQGTWESKFDMEDEHPVVYSAKGSHACYSKSGCYPRIFFAANDHTSKGYRWFPAVQEITENDPLWNTYIGRIGSPSEGSMPARKDYWNQEADSHATWWFRLFCCCKF